MMNFEAIEAAEKFFTLISAYLSIIFIAFILQLLANFVTVFSIRKNIKNIKEMVEEIYLPYKQQNDYDRSVQEEELNRKKAMYKDYKKQKNKEEWEEINNMLHTELNPKTTTISILATIIGLSIILIYYIFFS